MPSDRPSPSNYPKQMTGDQLLQIAQNLHPDDILVFSQEMISIWRNNGLAQFSANINTSFDRVGLYNGSRPIFIPTITPQGHRQHEQ